LSVELWLLWLPVLELLLLPPGVSAAPVPPNPRPDKPK